MVHEIRRKVYDAHLAIQVLRGTLDLSWRGGLSLKHHADPRCTALGREPRCFGKAISCEIEPVFQTRPHTYGSPDQGTTTHLVEKGELACSSHECLSIRGVRMCHEIEPLKRLPQSFNYLGFVNDFRSGLPQDVGSDKPSATVTEELRHTPWWYRR